MAKWSDDFVNLLEGRFGAAPERQALLDEFGWVEELHKSATELLAPQELEHLEPFEIYERLKKISLAKCGIRLTNLGRENEAGNVVKMVRALLSTPGGFAEKVRAAKVPQAGVVTLTGILCICRPHRFFIRNAPFMRGAAKAIPLYTKKALDELSYADLLDLCMELSRVQTGFFSRAGLGDWADRLRFLLLYAVLVN